MWEAIIYVHAFGLTREHGERGREAWKSLAAAESQVYFASLRRTCRCKCEVPTPGDYKLKYEQTLPAQLVYTRWFSPWRLVTREPPLYSAGRGFSEISNYNTPVAVNPLKREALEHPALTTRLHDDQLFI